MRAPASFFTKLLLASFLLLGAIAPALAQNSNNAAPRHDPAQIRLQVEHFLRTQTAGLPGETTATVGAVDERLSLPMCAASEAFLPNGARLWGRTSVGVRCTAPSPWTIYVTATIQVTGEYLVAATPLSTGQVLTSADVTKVVGDLTNLPSGYLNDIEQVIGRTASVSFPAGATLRADALRAPQVIRQGQNIRLVSIGPGFRVTAEGRALNNATEGQTTQARTPSGQVVSGVARAGGIIEVTY